MDSTVIAEEGIDILADFCGAAEAVADLTSRCCCANVCWLPFFVAAMYEIPTIAGFSWVDQWKREP